MILPSQTPSWVVRVTYLDRRLLPRLALLSALLPAAKTQMLPILLQAKPTPPAVRWSGAQRLLVHQLPIPRNPTLPSKQAVAIWPLTRGFFLEAATTKLLLVRVEA